MDLSQPHLLDERDDLLSVKGEAILLIDRFITPPKAEEIDRPNVIPSRREKIDLVAPTIAIPPISMNKQEVMGPLPPLQVVDLIAFLPSLPSPKSAIPFQSDELFWR